MAYTLVFPFFSFKLRMHAAGNFLSPLLDTQMLNANGPLENLAEKYAEKFQQKILNQGDFLKIMDESPAGPFYKASVKVSFPAASDGFSFPAFSLDFEYFYAKNEKGCWGLIPALGAETFADEEHSLETSLVETVKLEFARRHRLRDVHQIIAAIWYDTTELLRHDVVFELHTPRELEKVNEKNQEFLLPKVAKLLEIEHRVLYGCKAEMDQLARAVKNKFSKNVLLVGPTGVGKTTMVWELVFQQKKRRLNFNIWETTASTLIKELAGNTGWQDNLAFLCKELTESGDLLFIRNLLELFEVGQYAGNEVSMAEYLRSYISRGEVSIISECTEEERARIELRSPNFLSFFQVIQIEEPRAELESIILQKATDLARDKNIQLHEEAIRESIRLHRRFQPYSGFPGRPIRFLESIILNKPDADQRSIGRREVIQSFCEETGMPLFMVDPEVPMQPSAVKGRFNTQVFGQPWAVESVVDTLSMVKTALSRTGQPIASFLMVGPTGVGKTELAKELSAFMFGSHERLIRFDMSEFSDPYSVQRLIGESFFTDGLLTSAVRREPFCVLLFDEIEKAHPGFYDFLLQILGEGRLTDNRGKLVNFCSTIIIMTSNIGAGGLQQSRISWNAAAEVEEVVSHFRRASEKHFRPELFNRIDKVIPFGPLDSGTVRLVVDREISQFRKREGIRFRNLDLHLADPVFDFLAKKGYDPKYGARQLQRSIRELLIIPLSKQLNLEDYDEQLVVQVTVENDAVLILTEPDPMGIDLLMEALDKINYADHASELRREMNRFMEGHFFNRLRSQLDILEREKSRGTTTFWQDGPRNAQYVQLLETLAEQKKLTAKIEQLEEDLGKSCLDLIAFNPQQVEEVKQWGKQFFQFKLDLYYHYQTEGNVCFLAIYGNNLEAIMDLYHDLFRYRMFTVSARTIWFRESYYNEEIMSKDPLAEEVELLKKREMYIEEEVVNVVAERFVPPKKGDLLYGVVFEVHGKGAWLYLHEEEGLQRWKFSDEEEYHFQVITSGEAIVNPRNIHRRDFYKGNPRRIIEPDFFRDTRFKIKKEQDLNQLLPTLVAILDDQFVKKLNEELN